MTANLARSNDAEQSLHACHPCRFGARLCKGPELAMTIPVEEEITEVSMQPHFPPQDIAPATILDERYMRTGRTERTLALPGTLPPDAPIPDNK